VTSAIRASAQGNDQFVNLRYGVPDCLVSGFRSVAIVRDTVIERLFGAADGMIEAINGQRHPRLSMDAVQAANSGHPGMPMGMADVATVLFRNHLKFDPAAPHWFDRDRFVLSAGPWLDADLFAAAPDRLCARRRWTDIRNFRQLGQPLRRPPENTSCRSGVECTTGPLGQGIAMAVGMAMAERHLRAVRRPIWCRSQDLGHRRRRLPDGRHQPRGHRPCRPA
jgi:hypothetical protein